MKPIGSGEVLALAAMLPPLVLLVYAITAGKTPVQPALAAIVLASWLAVRTSSMLAKNIRKG